MGILFPYSRLRLGNGFPSLLLPVSLEQRVKGLPVHPGLARGSAQIAPAAGQHGLRIGDLKAGQVPLSRILPGKRGKAAGRRRIRSILLDVFRPQHSAGVQRRQPLHHVLQLAYIARPTFLQKRLIELRRPRQALAIAA